MRGLATAASALVLCLASADAAAAPEVDEVPQHSPHGEVIGEALHGEDDAHGAHDEHGEHGGKPLLAVIINTAIFFGVLGWFAGPWLVAWFRQRHVRIEQDLTAAARAREEAEKRLAEMERRLEEVDVEVREILETAGRQADAERERILTEARAEAERLLEQAERRAAETRAEAERELRETASDLAVSLARELVSEKMQPEDRGRLFERYLEGLRKMAS